MTDPFHSRLKIRSDHLAAIVISLVPIAYFFPAILSGAVLCPDDGLLQNVPFRVATAQIVRSGHLPLWNPYIFSGMPLLASAQVGILFPLNWFYLLWSASAATNLMVVSSYMMAALGAFLYSRRIGLTIAGAMLTSLVWQFSGALVGQISHINIVQTSALVPWTLWSLESYVADRSYKRGLLLALLIAVQLFAGHQQVFVYSLILLVVYAGAMAATNAAARKHYLYSLVFVAVGILLASVQILPTLELLRNSPRVSASYEFFTSFSMPKRFVLALLAPYLMGGGDGRLFRAPYLGPPYYQELVGYVGVVAIMLAVIALLIKPDGRTKFWAAIAVLCMVLAFGGYAPLQLYRLIYYLPLLNLFRVPARHLMEVDFALAILAGRGLTVLTQARSTSKVIFRVVGAGVAVFGLTLVTVIWLRPSEFHLGREAPVTVIRAPELFLPILISVASGAALWAFAKKKRGATVGLFLILTVDLVVWGQSSGWYTSSPKKSSEYWQSPEPVQRLHELTAVNPIPFRILTAAHQFDPAIPPVPPSVSHSPYWDLWTQPDVYMMHGIQNAAGYEGFGLSRYSELVGRMKVWGELTDPDATLRSGSREIDLVNVRYLLSLREQVTNHDLGQTVLSESFTTAPTQFGDWKFAAEDLGLPNLGKNKRISFSLPPTKCDRIALVTNLSWSENIADGKTVARLRLRSIDGREVVFPLHAGSDTAEWSHDRPDILSRIKHRRAKVAGSYQVNDPVGNYEAHTYVTSFPLPEQMTIGSGEIVLEPISDAPDLTLSVFRVSLANTTLDTTLPLRRDWIRVEDASSSTTVSANQATADRWKLVAQTRSVDIYENSRALPRVWLASEVRVLAGPTILEVIRTGKFSDGTNWDPQKIALVESNIKEVVQGSEGQAQVIRLEPNRLDVRVNSNTPSVLVLSENHYPGWRTYVDGNPVETLRVDYNLRGVPLIAGAHQVEFIYRPKSVLIGFLLSLVAAVGLALAPVIWRRFGGSLGS